MISVLRRIAPLFAVVIVGVGILTPAAPASASRAGVLAAQAVAATNKYRVAHGCRAVRVNSALARTARLHSYDMARRGYFSHVGKTTGTFVQRARRQGYNFAVGENLAMGHTNATTLVYSGWGKSPGHRRNLLDCRAKTVGIGVHFNAKGVPYWTQVFGAR
ncbi:CAP domain-containing protein [Pilimelia columellifera]|uniref:SCP domain-containing protein n=1 Tax=Pilimelia columellifera subsp. columellifera TaxID=706583 RepID=A0ABP6AYA8_9ACTN